MAILSPQHILQDVFGYSQFRHQQQAIVEHVIAGHDALVLMPTGGYFYNLLISVDLMNRYKTAVAYIFMLTDK